MLYFCILLSQLRTEKTIQVSCAAASSSLSDCTCNLGYVGNKAMLVPSSSLERSQNFSSGFRHGRSNRGSLELRKRHGECGRSEPKQTPTHVQARVQDSVEHETYDSGNELDGSLRCKDRGRRERTGTDRRRVQVITNNGFVDLEEQLGITKGRKGEGKLKLRLSSQQSGNKVQRDEEGRLYFEYEFNEADGEEAPEIDKNSFYSAEELQTRQGGDAPSLAQAAIPLEISAFLAFERGAGRSTSDGLSQGSVELDAEKQWYVRKRDGDAYVEAESKSSKLLFNTPGSQRVAELMGAWNGLAGRLPPEFATSNGSTLLLAALKLTVSSLRHGSSTEDGREVLNRALSVAFILADLRMDAEVIAAGLLREVFEAGYLDTARVETVLCNEVAILLKDCGRVKHMPSLLDTLDEASVQATRQFCLAFHDVRAVVVEVAARLVIMRHSQSLPRYKQQMLALETMQIYAPVAHAMGIGKLSHELEDLGFRVLFPDSYTYIGGWLEQYFADGHEVVQQCKEDLQSALEEDSEMQSLVEGIEISGRCKSKYSTMKKLLRDGRPPEEVFDVLGLRVVLTPRKSGTSPVKERGARACYRALEIATTLWKEVPGRLKDYITEPKKNGYESLHSAVSLSTRGNWSPLMEIQIRTAEMDEMAEGGLASHSLYKGGLTDPDQAGILKAIMQAAADVASTRFPDLTNELVEVAGEEDAQKKLDDQMFTLFDRNTDGVISMDEFKDVISELGGDEEDANELMNLVDSNFNGSVNAEEFKNFRRQVKLFDNLAGVDRQFTTQLDQRLLTTAANPTANGIDSQVDQMIPPEANATEMTVKSNRIASPSPSVQEPDNSSKELERQMWIDRVNDSVKGSTSSSNGCSNGNRSSVPSLAKPTKPAKPVKPASVLADKKNFSVGSSLSDLITPQTDGWQSSTFGENEKEDAMELHSEVTDVESDIDRVLTTARQQLAAGDVVGAQGILLKLAMKHPDSADVMFHLAQLERKRGDMVAAGAYYERTIGAFQKQEDYGLKYVKALQGWGSLEAQARNASRARYLYLESVRVAHRGEKNGVLEMKGAGVYGLHGWAMLEQKLGNWSKARELLERAASIQPGNSVVHQTRALLEARVHNYAAARYHFRLAVEAAPEDVKCWQAWALFESNQGKRRKMRQLFQKALDVEPENVHALQAWAHQESLINSDSARERARKLYQRCVEVNPNSMHSWQAWALLEQNAGNLTGARILFERGLGTNPRNVPCLQAYAHMERVNGNLIAAQKLLMTALSLEPENAAVLMEIALTEEAIGNKEVASEYFRKAGIVDKQKSRLKRRMFESRKAATKQKATKPNAKRG
ncbi:uncharacterized protein [Physcomitrium patens]|uniref:EF-hand domain-containing protein n=1 Tax=Physcomitrium patens TaxID=3218 RepID=A0A7I4D5W3_PHYPA|nr:uncharacterized protein LOC112276189 isoform X3 [Physcomitrium patens]XP_024363082.1 uncharacterized protein LOC112276189 isoform X3 [Physcomitrium patens]|eukprot:XP_024363075.1 uncharacterized protein LOC112276189 isoform X3 [Physcomitrella patens]